MARTSIRVAGRTVVDTLGALEAYAVAHSKTVREYDLAGSGLPDVLTSQEVARTRVIASRITRAEEAWFVDRGSAAPWARVPAEADLIRANPREPEGLYSAAVALYDHFKGRRTGVAVAKIHKVLHQKRPGLFPILDSRLMRRYRSIAAEQAMKYPGLGCRYLYWAAVRLDVMDESNRSALASLRPQLQESESAEVRAMARLTDLRLIDVLAWRSDGGSQ